jgi:hypothetical protein
LNGPIPCWLLAAIKIGGKRLASYFVYGGWSGKKRTRVFLTIGSSSRFKSLLSFKTRFLVSIGPETLILSRFPGCLVSGVPALGCRMRFAFDGMAGSCASFGVGSVRQLLRAFVFFA